MKNLVLLAAAAIASLGFSSCCSMFGRTANYAGYRTETRQVKTCGYDIVTEQVVVPGDTKGGMVQTVEKKVPHYKTVTKRVAIRGGSCARYYCATKDKCGTTSQETLNMATAQGASGSPFIGLMPSMKPLAP